MNVPNQFLAVFPLLRSILQMQARCVSVMPCNVSSYLPVLADSEYAKGKVDIMQLSDATG